MLKAIEELSKQYKDNKLLISNTYENVQLIQF